MVTLAVQEACEMKVSMRGVAAGIQSEIPYHLPLQRIKEISFREIHISIRDLALKFGEGEVLELNKENDVVTVSFDKESFGIRKLKLSMAGLKKIN